MTTLPKQTLLGSRLTNFDQLPNSALLTVNEIVVLANRSRTSIWRDVKNRKLPKPTAIGPQARRWRVGDVRIYLDGSVA